jgi:hypothetical protein
VQLSSPYMLSLVAEFEQGWRRIVHGLRERHVMDIPLAAPRSAAPCMGAATVRGTPGKRRDVDLFIEILNLRLTLDAIEFKNHINGHIKLLLVI